MLPIFICANEHCLTPNLLKPVLHSATLSLRRRATSHFLSILTLNPHSTTQSRIIGAVRGAHSQLWGTIIPVCSLYAARKYDRRFGTPAIV